MLGRRDMFVGAGAGAVGLLASSRATAGADGRGDGPEQAGNVAADLNQLRAAPVSNISMLYNGSIFLWTSGDYSKPPAGPADDINVIKQNDTPLTVGAWVRQYDTLSVRAFGAIEGPLASPATNTAAFKRAIAAAVALNFPLDLNGGTYLLDADGVASGGINFARAGLHIRGGGATLRFSGTGKAFVLDTGEYGQFIENISVEDITIIGGSGITDGFYSRGVVRSVFRNIAIFNVTGKAFHIKHGVANHYDSLKYSAWPGGQARPSIFATHGIYVDNNDDPTDPTKRGFYTASCTFINSVMENFPGVGCHVADGSGNLFLGGTFEAVATGLVTSQAACNNTFVKVWFEANSVADAVISGNNNGFLGPWFLSSELSGPNVQITAGGKGTWFASGGYIRFVNMAAGSSGTTFNQVGVDQNLEGTIGFQGTGSYTRINCKKIRAGNSIVGAYDDIVGPVESIGVSGSWTPVLTSASGAIAQNPELTQGTYNKIGKLVFAQCFIHVDSVRSPAGTAAISGLPYVSAFHQPGSIHATQLRASAPDSLQVRADRGSSALSLSTLSAGVAANMAADIKAGTALAVSIIYTAAD